MIIHLRPYELICWRNTFRLVYVVLYASNGAAKRYLGDSLLWTLDTVLICWKFSICTKDCLWLHFAGFLHSVPLPILEVTQPRFWRITVHWIWAVSSSRSELLIDGTAYHSMWLTLQASMRSRMVSILWEEIWWAYSWTDWSVWPYGLTCFWGSSGTGAAAPGKLLSHTVKHHIFNRTYIL